MTSDSKLIRKLIFLVSFILYLNTSFPSIHFGDTPELIGASYTLGNAHPSGYPIYLIISKLFSFIPFGSLAFRLNILSALLGSASLVVLFVFFENLLDDSLSALISIVVFGLSFSVWSQSIIAEVYTLNNLFIGLLLFFTYKFVNTDNRGYLLLSMFLFGLGMSNHITVLLITPSLLFYIIWEGKGKKLLNSLIFCVMFFLIGYSVYLYLLVRASSDSPAKWFGEGGVNFVTFFKYVFISKDQDIIYLDAVAKPLVFLINAYYEIFLNYIKLIPNEFSYILLPFIPFGIFKIFKKNVSHLLFFITFLLPFIVLFVVFCDPKREEAAGVFVIPSFLMFSVFIGCGITMILDLCNKYFEVLSNHLQNKYSFKYLFVIIFIVSLIFLNYKKNDQSRNYIAYDYGKNILNTPSFKSRFNYRVGTQDMYSLFYLNEYVENYRNDLIYSTGEDYNNGYKNYLFFLNPNYDKGSFELYPSGLLYELAKIKELKKINYWDYLYTDDLNIKSNYKDIKSRYVLGDYYYKRSEFETYLGNLGKALEYEELSVKNNPVIFYEKGKRFLRDGNVSRARALFEKVKKYYPEHGEINYNLGIMEFNDGKYELSKTYLNNVKTFDEVSVESFYVLGKIYYENKDIKNAAYYWKKYLKYKPYDLKAKEVKMKLNLLHSIEG